jgi:hypothetical protein
MCIKLHKKMKMISEIIIVAIIMIIISTIIMM